VLRRGRTRYLILLGGDVGLILKLDLLDVILHDVAQVVAHMQASLHIVTLRHYIVVMFCNYNS
jgi:hypothetical protein